MDTNTSLWTAKIGGFAEITGKDIAQITERLTPVVGEPSDAAATLLMDKEAAPDTDLKAVFNDLQIPSAILNKAIAYLRLRPEAAEGGTIAIQGQTAMTNVMSVLPPVPDEDSFIKDLKTGGDLRVGSTEVISAVKAALASNLGVFELPRRILNSIEKFAVSQRVSCPSKYYELQREIGRRRYADILNAVGAEGFNVTTGRKEAFLRAVSNKLWVALDAFNNRLREWNKAWRTSMPQELMVAAILTKNEPGNNLAQDMLTQPDTGPIRVAAEAFVNTLNSVFAGTAIPVARALAFDATWITKLVTDDTLPALVGAGNREQMLRKLGIDVGSDIVMVEKQLVAFTLAILELNAIKPENEMRFIMAMIQLSGAIPWPMLFGQNARYVPTDGDGNPENDALDPNKDPEEDGAIYPGNDPDED